MSNSILLIPTKSVSNVKGDVPQPNFKANCHELKLIFINNILTSIYWIQLGKIKIYRNKIFIPLKFLETRIFKE